MFDLSGRVAIIPGGGGAIGSALAHGLADAGAAIALVGRSKERVDQAAARVSVRWAGAGDLGRRH